MNYRRHYFLLNASGIIGAVIGGLVWFVDASVRMFSTSVAKMPFDSISWRLHVYPLLGIIWNLAAPDEPATAALSRSRRGLFIALGILFVAASLLAPILRSH